MRIFLVAMVKDQKLVILDYCIDTCLFLLQKAVEKFFELIFPSIWYFPQIFESSFVCNILWIHCDEIVRFLQKRVTSFLEGSYQAIYVFGKYLLSTRGLFVVFNLLCKRCFKVVWQWSFEVFHAFSQFWTTDHPTQELSRIFSESNSNLNKL